MYVFQTQEATETPPDPLEKKAKPAGARSFLEAFRAMQSGNLSWAEYIHHLVLRFTSDDFEYEESEYTQFHLGDCDPDSIEHKEGKEDEKNRDLLRNSDPLRILRLPLEHKNLPNHRCVIFELIEHTINR